MTRLEKIREVYGNFADAMLISSEENRFYASGMKSSAGCVLLTPNKSYLFLDFRYYEAAVRKRADGIIDSSFDIVQTAKPMTDYVKEVISASGLGAATVAVENMSLTAYEYDNISKKLGEAGITVVGDNGAVTALRAVKDEAELSTIKSAQKITDAAFTHILSYIKPGVAERDIALELEYFMHKNGADGIAFDTICVSGRKSSLPHGVPDETVIDKGFVTMDFGSKFGGYCSDMTRTVCVGKPDADMIKVYNTVAEAQKRALESIKANVIGSEVDAAARDFIYASGYEGCFGHSTGHSLGIEIHENPNFSPSCKSEIPEGAVLSVEPGIYINGKYGVRIEDIVEITADGCKNLTESKKHLIIL